MLYYSIDHPEPDNNYFTVSVVPINGAGQGEDATKRFSLFGKLNLYSVYTLTRAYRAVKWHIREHASSV